MYVDTPRVASNIYDSCVAVHFFMYSRKLEESISGWRVNRFLFT